MLKKITIVASLMFPAFNAFAEEVKWPKPPTGYDKEAASIPKGSLSASLSYTTTKYNERKFKIYLPPNYSATRAEKYPVLYLHHGIGGNESAWSSSASGQSEGNADKVMDYLYAQASLNVTPMLVVMPMGNMSGTSGDAWANYEEVEKNDLAPYIEKTYNASSSASMRAIAGLSMGAGQTLNFGYKNPTFYNWIGAFSPAPNTIGASTTVKDIAAIKANVKLNFLAAGTTETSYLSTARSYHNFLNQNGITPLFLQVEEGLNHERENWNRQLHNFAQRIFKGGGTGIVISPKTDKMKISSRLVFDRLGGTSTILVSRGLASGRIHLNGRQFSGFSSDLRMDAVRLPQR